MRAGLAGKWEDNRDFSKLNQSLKNSIKMLMERSEGSDGYKYPYTFTTKKYTEEELDFFVNVTLSVLLDELDELGEIKKDIINFPKE